MGTENAFVTTPAMSVEQNVGRPGTARRRVANRPRRAQVSPSFASSESLTADGVVQDGALPKNDFLKQLGREQRRSERSKVALSLIVYRIADEDGLSARNADVFLELLHDAKRETDILGHVGSGMIAVLCPDTDAKGTKGFMRKIEDLSGDFLEGVAATYPDHLFETLAAGTRTQPAFQPFLQAEAAQSGRAEYLFKRSLDVFGSVIALMLIGPLMLVLAVIIALTSPGPVIFKQKRLGRGGVPFTFYKFRSMTTNLDDSIHRDYVAKLIKGEQVEAAGDTAGPQFKMRSDPRVTPIGRLIRKSSMDELPQFFNVLKGDMSIVGPRPCIPYEATHYQSWHLRRVLSVKPGITGLWQVDGRSKVTFNEMVRMDLKYIRECSLALDLKIVLKTVLVVLRCDGAA